MSRTLLSVLGALCLSATIASAQSSPGTPTGLTVTQVGTRLQVAWNAPAPSPATIPPDGYIVTFHAGPASTISSSTIVASQRTGPQTNFEVNIPPGTTGTYTAVVAAFTGTGITGLGSASQPVTFTIGGGGNCSAPPLTPTNVQATRSDRVRLTWQPSPGASSYRVLAQVPPANTPIFDAPVGNVTEVSGAVNPATPLLLSVSAINACGESPLSPPFSLPAAGGPIVCIPDAQTLCLFDGRFTVRLTAQPPGGVAGPAIVTRRFDDGGGFSFVNGSNVEDLFVRIENRCSTTGTFAVSFNNRSGFGISAAFDLFVGDNRGSISRDFVHQPGVQFVSFQDVQSFNSCP